jgi:hypothetical protein
LFLKAVEAWKNWKAGQPEPTIAFEVNGKPQQITISRACGLLRNCTDFLPEIVRQDLKDCGLYFECKTCLSAARAMKYDIQHGEVGDRHDTTTVERLPAGAVLEHKTSPHKISRMLIVEPARNEEIRVCWTSFGGIFTPHPFKSDLNRAGHWGPTDAPYWRYKKRIA